VKLVARLPAQFEIKRGDALHLKADSRRVHLFHENRRLGMDLP
jgi:hypothetical protein